MNLWCTRWTPEDLRRRRSWNVQSFGKCCWVFSHCEQTQTNNGLTDGSCEFWSLEYRKKFFRVTVFNTFIDFYIMDLETRFTKCIVLYNSSLVFIRLLINTALQLILQIIQLTIEDSLTEKSQNLTMVIWWCMQLCVHRVPYTNHGYIYKKFLRMIYQKLTKQLNNSRKLTNWKCGKNIWLAVNLFIYWKTVYLLRFVRKPGIKNFTLFKYLSDENIIFAL